MADYVNNKEFYNELVEYHAAYKQSLIDGTDKPVPNAKICAAIMQIPIRMATAHNFSGYTYKDEMISYATMRCFEKVHTFDPAKSDNPFAFYSQIIYNSFIFIIKRENHQSSVKARLIRDKMSSEFVAHGVDFDTEESGNSFVEFLVENDCYIDYYEQRKIRDAQPEQSGGALKHRNKTPYRKKEEQIQEVLEEVNIFEV